jgi:hypothetical protein
MFMGALALLPSFGHPCRNLRKMKFKFDMGLDDMSEDDVYNDWQTGNEVICPS